MSNVKIIFNRKKTASKTTLGTVEIEISSSGKRKWVSTGVRLYINQWRNGVVVKHPQAFELNNKILQMYHQIAASGDNPIAVIQAGLFINWLDNQIEMRADLRESTKKQHKVMARDLRKFGRIVEFKDLTRANILLWNDHLQATGIKQTSLHGYHRRLKPYVKKAFQLGLINANPYDLITIARGKSEDIKYITEKERDAIISLELSGGAEIARDLFVFMCYTGLAYADMVRVSRDDIFTDDNGVEYIVDKRQKTNSSYKLMILPKAREVLEKYNYNLNQMSNQKINMYLKGIGAAVRLRIPLTCHVGRHTFATWALRNGVRIEVVSKMLAHADIKTTQVYAKVLQEEVSKGFEQLMNK